MLDDSLRILYILDMFWFGESDGVDIELTNALQSSDYIYAIHVEDIHIYNSQMQ